MEDPHRWQTCEPLLIPTDPKTDHVTRKLFQDAALRVFKGLPSDEKIAIHNFCCNNRTNAANTAVMERFAAKIQEAVLDA